MKSTVGAWGLPKNIEERKLAWMRWDRSHFWAALDTTTLKND